MKNLKYLQKLFFLLVMGFSLSFVCAACGDDEEDEPFQDPNQEQTDNGGNVTDDGGTSPTDSIMSPTDDPVLPNDSTMSPTDDPVLPNDSTSGGNDEPIVSVGTLNGHHWVDLGLPSGVKWATCNVGASSPEEYGDYFAWGETTTKSNYDFDNSITHYLSTSTLKSRGIIGSDGNLTAAYDAATANWGGSWRMPTLDEIKELLNDCTWTWTTQSGVNGRKVTGPNGNSIFLPAAGYRSGTFFNCAGFGGYYWSASLSPNGDSYYACRFYFESGFYDWFYYYRRLDGLSVRPVSE